ncbi:MAG: AIR synthase family protein [Lachnospiraceae bacterium]|nr:AIR synthase family protein [Lachnospiraceae bacterium]
MRPGKLSDSILKRTVLKQIKQQRSEVLCGAGIGEDCAIFACEDGNLVSSVVSYVVADRQDMIRSIYKATNNLATAGAEPFAVMLSIILPERASEEKLKKLMDGAAQAARELNLQIAGGHTTVSRYVSEKLVTVTAYGKVPTDKTYTTKGAKPGQDVVMTKWIGLEGTAILANKKREELLTRYPEYLVEEAASFDKYLSVIPEAATAVKSGVCVMHDASEGGILATLWELAESSGVGLHIDMKKLPIRQETVEVCEFCDVNPYELLSGGCLVMTAEDGNSLVLALQEQGIPAVVVGKITDSKDRMIFNGEEKRFLDKPAADEIYKYI